MNEKMHTAPEAAPVPRTWTTLELINWTKSFFEKKGLESPRLEAELLLAEALGCARIRLYVDFEKPVEAAVLARFRDFVLRRAEKREPLQYIIGHTQFVHLKIKTTPAALIPRPETEILAVWAAERTAEFPKARVLDLCTGTGCVALYIASKTPAAHVVATDVSVDALNLARENAQALKLEERITFLEGDLFGALHKTYSATPFDLIVGNPPYIDRTTRDTLQPEVRNFEPETALFAAECGLAVTRRILSGCDVWMKPGGRLGLEFGADQSESILQIARSMDIFEESRIELDGSGLPRFLFARKRV